MNFLEIDKTTAIRIDKICAVYMEQSYYDKKWRIIYTLENSMSYCSKAFKTRKEAEEAYNGILPIVDKLAGRQNSQINKLEIDKLSENEYKRFLNLFKTCIVTRSQVSNGHGFDYFVHIMDKNPQETPFQVTFQVPKKDWEMIGEKINELAEEKKANGKISR